MSTQNQPASSMALLESLVLVKHVTLPFYIIPEDGTPAYLRFETAFVPDTSSFSDRVRKRRGGAADTKPDEPKKPMDIATCVNLNGGETVRVVAHQVLKNTLDETYPSDSYVGKIFRIVKAPKKNGYYSFDIAEMRIDKPATDAAKNTAVARK